MICQNCKTTLPETAKFCNSCGTKVNVDFCPNGHVLEPGEAHCRYCPPHTKDTNRISVSTTIEKVSAPSDRPSDKTTIVETGLQPDPDNTPVFGTTRMIQEKEEEQVGLAGWLVVVDGPDKWRDFRITKRKMTIGRARDCDIVIDDVRISAKHASLRLQEDGLYITDLDSSNGTFVNGQEAMKTRLTDNDLVTVGDVSLKFKGF